MMLRWLSIGPGEPPPCRLSWFTRYDMRAFESGSKIDFLSRAVMRGVEYRLVGGIMVMAT
jgi:hypothetical protein